jgi:hypothetical protein
MALGGSEPYEDAIYWKKWLIGCNFFDVFALVVGANGNTAI